MKLMNEIKDELNETFRVPRQDASSVEMTVLSKIIYRFT